MAIDPLALRLAAVFDRCFAVSHRTVVRLGADAPVYRPPEAASHGEILCHRDYPASVLHEVAHWCVASAARRRRADYGYWYVPPPRSAATQARFLLVEERNQALECLFATAAGLRFEVSLDATGDDGTQRRDFTTRVRARAAALAAAGLPSRAARYRTALVAEFGRG
jgi:elongation factor P hydroxylase